MIFHTQAKLTTLLLTATVVLPARADTANTAAVVTAANTFMAPLTTAQKSAIDATSSNTNTSSLYNATLANAGIWSNLPTAMTTRNGLRFTELSSTNQTNALAAATAALSTNGRQLLDDVRAADRFIGGETTRISPTTGSPNSSMWGYGKYFIAFVGTPSTSSPWTFQFGGHHLAYNITYNGTYLSGTPIFAGTEPNSFTDNTGSYAPLGKERTAIVALRNGGSYTPVYTRLDGTQTAVTATAVTSSALLSGTFSDVVMGANGTGNHDTVFPKSYPTSGRGQLYSALTAAQQVVVVDYIKVWVNYLNSSIADELLAIYLSPQALAETYVGYAGSSATLSGSNNYFRVDGPRFWVEFSVQGGVFDSSSYHDHGVVRDKLADYGAAYGSTTISTTVRPPAISTNPSNKSAVAGGSATFSVAAASTGTGSATLAYQWYKDGSAISGATAASYPITGASSANVGTYYVQVISTGGLVSSTSATFALATAPTISTSSPLAGGTVGSAYSQTLAATGGTSPYTWTVDSGTVPTNLTLSTGGILSGNPSTAGTFTFTAKVTDNASATSTKSFSVTIIDSLGISTTSPLAAGTVGSAYSQTLAATGGTSPYTWTVDSGTIPTNLTLSTGGILSGTPSTAGTFSFTAKVTDSASATSTQSFSVTITEPVTSYLALYGLATDSWTVDSDDDGISNLAEFILGGIPTTGDTSILPVLAVDSGTLSYSFNVPVNPGSVSWKVQYTADPAGTWSPAVSGTDDVTITTSSATSTTNHVSVSMPATDEKRFIRLSVTSP